MGQLNVTGNLIAGPPLAGGDGVFPSMEAKAAIRTSPSPRLYNAATGVLTQNVDSSGSPLTLAGIGANQPVPFADFFYIRTEGALDIELTYLDGVGGSTAATIRVRGTLLLEFESGRELTQVTAQGVSKVEYFASGQRLS